MDFRIENAVVLFGLFALAIPIVLHFLKRRHHETVLWGAMQFLPENVAAQRKRWLDEILLLLLRMAMIGAIVVALATPISTSAWLAPLSDRASRDVVIVVDGSYSMGMRLPGESTPWTSALAWIDDRVERAHGRESFTFLLARQPPVFVTIEELGKRSPLGNPDLPRALKEAWAHLQQSRAANKELVVLTDGQLHGWADAATLAAFDDLGRQWHADVQRTKSDGIAVPSLRVVRVGPALPKSLPNYSLAALTAPRGFVKVGDEMQIESELRLTGADKAGRPRSVTVLIDGKKHSDVALPTRNEFAAGKIPLRLPLRID
ncbi:MAG: BatA domain-containing protein, partial [Planctomycetes bacterium]|nr:BatA domain-containing protein [Planctomycetota bacterium]